jgi:hypothetical protein
MSEEVAEIKWDELIGGLRDIGERFVATILEQLRSNPATIPEGKLLDRDRRGLTAAAEELRLNEETVALADQLTLVVNTYANRSVNPSN